MTNDTFAHPIDARYFEDYVAGAIYEYGPATLSEAEIIAFARQFDPQSIHVDKAKAEAGPFHGLIASGWHTIGTMMRLYVDHYLTAVASLASPGIDEVRWTRPVRPGDALRLRVTILEARGSRSKPDRGLVVSFLECINQEDIIVCTLKAMNLIAKRKEGSASF